MRARCRYKSVLLLFVAALAMIPGPASYAGQDTQESPASSAPSSSTATPSSTTASPAAVGIHSAGAFYPEEARRLNEEGDVRIGFTILADGSVSKPVVIKSSGYADLDAAAVTAASTWRYKPAMRDGVPVAVPWQTMVQFRLADPEIPSYMPVTVINMTALDYPSEALAAQEGGDTWLLINLSGSGLVTGALVIRSSGSQRLDQAAISIATGRWRFTAATRDGEPMKSIVVIDARWTPPSAKSSDSTVH
jgi:protein TonB